MDGNIKICHLAHGNHNNLWLSGKVRNIVTFKIVVLLDTEEAYIVHCSISHKAPQRVDEFLDRNLIHQSLKTVLEDKDFKLITKPTDILRKRSKEVQKEFVDSLYNK